VNSRPQILQRQPKARPLRRLVSGAVLGLLNLSLLAADAASPPAIKAAELFPDELVVKGQGFEIWRSQFDEAVTAFKATMAAQRQPIPDSQQHLVETNILDRMIFARILLQKATAEDKAKAKEAADKFVAAEKRRAPSEESFKRRLLALGMSPELFAARALEDKLVEEVVQRELKARINITTEQAKEFYDAGIDPQVREAQALVDNLAKTGPQTVSYAEGKKRLEELKKANLARLDRPEQARVSHIVIYTIDRLTNEQLPEDLKKVRREQMQKIVEKLKAGEDFTKLAKEYSEDPEVGETGGEYTVAREADIAPELKTLLFSLPTNQLSDVLTTKYGYHVAKVHERTPAGKPPFEKVEKEIREFLLGQELQRQLPAYFAQLKQSFAVEMVKPRESK
jgi:parvulin-like peptidyl-prolyl isomerase